MSAFRWTDPYDEMSDEELDEYTARSFARRRSTVPADTSSRSRGGECPGSGTFPGAVSRELGDERRRDRHGLDTPVLAADAGLCGVQVDVAEGEPRELGGAHARVVQEGEDRAVPSPGGRVCALAHEPRDLVSGELPDRRAVRSEALDAAHRRGAQVALADGPGEEPVGDEAMALDVGVARRARRPAFEREEPAAQVVG